MQKRFFFNLLTLPYLCQFETSQTDIDIWSYRLFECVMTHINT